MSALSDIQQEWTKNTDENFITGILLWDLSAAFDTLSADIFCQKLKAYGFDQSSRSWFMSFLSGRSQKVKVGGKLSKSKEIETGVPQGGILSPIIFIIYGADLEDWLRHSLALTYADDTSTSVKGKTIEEVLAKLEEDAGLILRFMASNGLVANPTKMAFMMLNSNRKKDESPLEIHIGNALVKQESSAKLLGVKIEDNQKWKEQVSGSGGVIKSLNKRLFFIRRLKKQVDESRLTKVVDSIWTSKLRYGIQLYAKVRTSSECPSSKVMEDLQKTQNKLVRTLENVRIKDKNKTSDMLTKHKMLSVNQLQAQVKLTELWKVVNTDNNPLKFTHQSPAENGRETRAVSNKKLVQTKGSTLTNDSFIYDATRLWNMAPESIKMSKSLLSAKAEIKKFCVSLPL